MELLELRRQIAAEPPPSAYKTNCYARALITIEPADLRDAVLGLEMALQAYELSTDRYHYNRYTLALAYHANGHLDLALELVRRALEHVPLEVSDDRILYEAALAGFLEEAGDATAAEEVYGDTLAARRTHFQDGHPDIANSLEDLATTLIRHGKHAEAEALLQECLDIRRFALPEGHRRTARTMGLLGGLLTTLEQFPEAEPLLLRSYADVEDNEEIATTTTARALERLTALYNAWERPDRLVEYQMRLRSLRE